MKYFIIIGILFLTGCSPKMDFLKFSAIYQKPTERKVKVAVVLGGGGARAIAHLGVLEVFEEHGIPVDLVVGVSGGSIVGALYADNPSAKAIKQTALNFKTKNLVDISLLNAFNAANSLKGSFDGSIGARFLERNMRAKHFHELKVPFVAVVTDIVTCKTIGLNSGNVAQAVRASYAIPGLFAPIKNGQMTLVDGGVSAPLPVDIAKQYAPDVIIAIDVSIPLPEADVNNMLALIRRSAAITYQTLNHEAAKEADVLIKPNVGTVGMFDDDKNEELYLAGKRAAMEKIDEIKEKLRKHNYKI